MEDPMQEYFKQVAGVLSKIDAITTTFCDIDEKQLLAMWDLLNLIMNSGSAATQVTTHWCGVLRGVCRAKYGYDFMTRQMDDEEFDEFQSTLEKDDKIEE